MRSLLLLAAAAAVFAQSPKYGIGRPPTPEELKAWSISVSPDGKGLPEGRGTAAEGAEMFANRCARCHGPKGEGKESVALVGGMGTLKNPKPLRTVGSFWPYATTVFDYINRAMPLTAPRSLTDSQYYAVTAYLLQREGIIAAGTVIDAKSLPKVQMPARSHFVVDDRAGTTGGKSVR